MKTVSEKEGEPERERGGFELKKKHSFIPIEGKRRYHEWMIEAAHHFAINIYFDIKHPFVLHYSLLPAGPMSLQ